MRLFIKAVKSSDSKSQFSINDRLEPTVILFVFVPRNLRSPCHWTCGERRHIEIDICHKLKVDFNGEPKQMASTWLGDYQGRPSTPLIRCVKPSKCGALTNALELE